MVEVKETYYNFMFLLYHFDYKFMINKNSPMSYILSLSRCVLCLLEHSKAWNIVLNIEIIPYLCDSLTFTPLTFRLKNLNFHARNYGVASNLSWNFCRLIYIYTESSNKLIW